VAISCDWALARPCVGGAPVWKLPVIITKRQAAFHIVGEASSMLPPSRPCSPKNASFVTTTGAIHLIAVRALTLLH
jgi:hypothetical protein